MILLHLLYRTGCRSGEVASLQQANLNLSTNCILITADQAKDNEDRVIYFGNRVKADLRQWLNTLTEQCYRGGWVFTSLRYNRTQDWHLTTFGINQMFHRRLKQSGLPLYRVHDLRHSFTKAAIDKGISLSNIQKQLGHTTPEMVLRYAKVFSNEQREAFLDFGDD